jgi:hypothetical protein
MTPVPPTISAPITAAIVNHRRRSNIGRGRLINHRRRRSIAPDGDTDTEINIYPSTCSRGCCKHKSAENK